MQRALAHTCHLLGLSHMCFACRLDTPLGMLGELSVCNPPVPDVCHSFLNMTVSRLWQKKGNKQNSSICTACLQGMLQTKGSARAAVCVQPLLYFIRMGDELKLDIYITIQLITIEGTEVLFTMNRNCSYDEDNYISLVGKTKPPRSSFK